MLLILLLNQSRLKDFRSVIEFNYTVIMGRYKEFHMDCPSTLVTVFEIKMMYRKRFPYGDDSAFAEHVFRAFDTKSKEEENNHHRLGRCSNVLYHF